MIGEQGRGGCGTGLGFGSEYDGEGILEDGANEGDDDRMEGGIRI